MELELTLLWIAIVSYVFSGTTAMFGVILKKKPEKAVLGLLVLGLVIHAFSIGLRWERLGHGPFLTMFEILSSNVFSLLAAFAIAYWKIKVIRPIAAVVMPIMYIMMGWLMVSSPGEGVFPPTYHTPLLYIHVGLGKVFMGAVLVAVGLACIVLLRARGIGVNKFANLPSDERLDDLAYRFMALGLIFETLMLIVGALWAQDAWGRYWAWDPLETWAFVTWLTLAFSMHMRFTLKVSAHTGAVMIVAVFVMAFFTFFGVPFVSTSPHKGAV